MSSEVLAPSLDTATTELDFELPRELSHNGSGTLNPLETFKIAWRSIRGNVLRSILTTLGVVIGVGAVVALISIGNGVTSNITSNLSSFGTNLLSIRPGSSGRGGHPGLVRAGTTQSITVKDAEVINDLSDPRIAALAPYIQSSQQVKAGSSNTNSTVIGTWPGYLTARDLEVENGSFFTDEEVRRRQRAAVIGYDLVSDLFPGSSSKDVIGQSIKINNTPYKIMGILAEQGVSTFSNPNTNIFIPLDTYFQRIKREEYKGEPIVNAIYVKSEDKDVLDALQADLTQVIALEHDVLEPEKYDFNIRNQANTLDTVNSVLTTLTIFLGAVAGISLLVGGIGIMNIMLVSVTERTREIGVRKALGARQRDILTQFLIESIVLSGGGGIIGILTGILIAFVAANLAGFPFLLSPMSIVLAFGFSVAVGVFFGYYPARRAAKLDPVASLRYE